MTATERTALITYSYDYMTDIADESFDEYRSGKNIDKYITRGKHVYRLIRALERWTKVTVKNGVRLLEGELMNLSNIYGRPASPLFTPLTSVEYKTRYITDGYVHEVLSQAEYDALSVKQPNTIYIII